jgi:hypothetical protein
MDVASLERVQQYLVIDHEQQATDSGIPPAYWPASGDLRVKNLSAKYSAVSTMYRLSIIEADVPAQNRTAPTSFTIFRST